ncbi:MAG: hypothetical protein JWQ71_1075, partial [Pedosphaera sp.]|nr:hypothetical protein [Pedosphaera sp.]
KIYDETPKPADAQGDEIESWRKAIVKYCGIPQAELSEQHGLEVYEHMNEGYHDYGIEWPKHPVNLEPMRAEVAKIKAEARAKTEAEEKAEEVKNLIPAVAKKTISGKPIKEEASLPVVGASTATGRPAWMTWAAILLGLLVVAAAFYMMRSPKNVSSRK